MIEKRSDSHPCSLPSLLECSRLPTRGALQLSSIADASVEARQCSRIALVAFLETGQKTHSDANDSCKMVKEKNRVTRSIPLE
jgi:hypothetical protein